MTKKKFLYNLSRASYEKEWGKKYDQPTGGEKFLERPAVTIEAPTAPAAEATVKQSLTVEPPSPRSEYRFDTFRTSMIGFDIPGHLCKIDHRPLHFLEQYEAQDADCNSKEQ